MKAKIFLMILTTLMLSACKKDYTCMCDDPKIEQSGFKIHDTKSKAERKCGETKNPNNNSKCYLLK